VTKIEKEPDGSWNWQLSLKLGRNNQQMLNVRAENWEKFKEALTYLTADAGDGDGSFILGAVGAFDSPDQATLPLADVRALPPALAQMAATPAPAAGTAGQNIGPLQVLNYSAQNGVGKSGRPYTRHVVTFQGGIKASTFDSLLADIAQKLIGQMAMATFVKSRFGYELHALRPAA
jgi:hypothetical protein